MTGQPESSTTPRPNTARDVAQIAVFAALIAALGAIPAINLGGGVPITAQTLGVMLAGAILGARKGFLAVLLFLVVALPLPLLAGGRTALVAFASPSAGYLVGWLLGAFVIGWGTARILPKYPLVAALLITFVGGIVAIYLLGVSWAAVKTNWAAAIASTPKFLPGDLIKVVLTVLVAKAVHRALPGLITPRRWISNK